MPWGANARDRFVKSSSCAAPHLVRKDAKKRSYSSDGNCPMFKGFSICSHVVATAEVNDELQAFVNGIKGTCTLNLSSIADYGMPSGSGRKVGANKRKRIRTSQPVESHSIRPSLDPFTFLPSVSTSGPSMSSHSTLQPSVSLPVSSQTQAAPLIYYNL